ncbi:MAG: SCO family protein [Aestuariivirgaceae bacterium]
MKRSHFAAILISAVVAVTGLAAFQFMRTEPATVRSTGTALVGGPFVLTGHDGKKVADEQFRGKYMLVFFGYTYCPDVCPAGLQVMTGALEKLGSDAKDIQPLFITVDPERDTVPVLADYMGHFHPRLIGLTGTTGQIADVAKAYRVYYKKAGDESGNDYLMDHSSILYLMGPQGQFVKHFAYGTDIDALAGEIRAAVAQN